MRSSIIILPEDTKMRFHQKGGIEHRQYLRLKNVVASVRGFPRQGGLRVGQGKTYQTLIFSQCCANSVANQRNSIRKGSKVSQQRHRRTRPPAETCLSVWSDLGSPRIDLSQGLSSREKVGKPSRVGGKGRLVTSGKPSRV